MGGDVESKSNKPGMPKTTFRRIAMERISTLLVHHRIVLLSFAGLAIVLATYPSLQLDFDRRVESMFPANDPRLAGYQRSKELFGGAETCAVAYTDDALLTEEGLERVRRLGERLRQLPGVESALSLADARLPSAPFDPRPLAQQLQAGTITPRELREQLLTSELYRGVLLGPDGQTTVIVVQIAPGERTAVPAEETIEQIRRVAASHDPPALVAGPTVLVHDVYRHLDEDGRLLGIASTVLLTVVIALLFRNLRWVLLPLMVVHVTLIWTKALLVATGVQMTMVSSPLVALVTVIGVATVVHITMGFREARDRHAPLEALVQTGRHVGPPVFWTCLTTAAGFGALLASQVVPVQNFGGMLAIGSLLVFLAVIALVPSGVLLGRFDTDPHPPPGEGKLIAGLNRVMHLVEKHPRWLVVGSVVVVALATSGSLRLEVATDFSDNFREDSPIVQSYEFLAKRLGPVASMDVIVDTPETVTPEFVDNLAHLQQDIEHLDGIEGTVSIVDLMAFLNPSADRRPGGLGGLISRGLRLVPPEQRLALIERLEPGLLAGFWNRPQRATRIVVRVRPVPGSKARRQLIEDVQALGRRRFPSATVAGMHVLLTYLVENLLADQWVTFGIAVVGIFLMMVVAFRSWWLGLIALIPNAAPIVVVIGSMGWLGLQVNVATAMIASVSMGLSIDFSIHYLYRFQRERRAGQDLFSALRAAHHSVGRAIVLADVALVAGFTVLCISQFIPTVHFGLLVSVAMLGGLVGNLFLLPLLLARLYRNADGKP